MNIFTRPTGGAGGGGQWLTTSGAPTDDLGVDGAFCIDTQVGDIYQKLSGSWGEPVMRVQGATGATGESFHVDEYADLDEAKIADITANSGATPGARHFLVILTDLRSDVNIPAGITGDMSRHLIVYDGTDWYDFGPFTAPASGNFTTWETASTENQTEFILPWAFENIAVYVQGVRQYSDAYQVTDRNKVTFNTQLPAGLKVLFCASDLSGNNANIWRDRRAFGPLVTEQFEFPIGYQVVNGVPQVDVYVAGHKLNPSELTAVDGQNVILVEAAQPGQVVELVALSQSLVHEFAFETGMPLVNVPSSRELTDGECRGTQVGNYGQTEENTSLIPVPKETLNFLACVETTGAGAWHFKPDSDHAIRLGSTLLTNGNKISFTDPAEGDYCTLFARRNSSGTWYWQCVLGNGTPVDGGQ